MPLHVELNDAASEADLDAVEDGLGGPLPACLREILARHDGAQTYAESGELGWILHGTRAARIVRDGALARSTDAAEYLDYVVESYGDVAPLIAETASFADWLDALRDEDLEAFPRGYVCVAAHWGHHGSCWAPLRAEATELLFIPSPRVDDVEALDAALRGPRVPLAGFAEALFAGEEPM
ncbi:MAG: SMI1/KNR4 family protein [Polyangiales bacterium]